MANATRNDLPTTPNVGASRPTSSTSGRRVRLPTGTANTGTPFNRNCVAASTGGDPAFQSPSEASTIPIRFLWVTGASASGAQRFVPFAPSGAEMGWMTTSSRSRSFFQNESLTRPPIASRRVTAGPFRDTASRVSMLREASHSTATEGFSSERYSSTISGWFSRNAPSTISSHRSNSKSPADRRYPLRRKAAKHNTLARTSTAADAIADPGVHMRVKVRVAFTVAPLSAEAAFGKHRPASTTIIAIIAPRNSRQISWISEPASSARSSVRTEIEPVEQPRHAVVGHDGRLVLAGGPIDGQQAITGRIRAAVQRVAGRHGLLVSRHSPPRGRGVVARLTGHEVSSVAEDRRPELERPLNRDIEDHAVGGQRRIGRCGRGCAEMDSSPIRNDAADKRLAAAQRGKVGEVARHPAVSLDSQFADGQ